MLRVAHTTGRAGGEMREARASPVRLLDRDEDLGLYSECQVEMQRGLAQGNAQSLVTVVRSPGKEGGSSFGGQCGNPGERPRRSAEGGLRGGSAKVGSQSDFLRAMKEWC